MKILFGLNQAPKYWHEKFDQKVLSHCFRINEFDMCVYSKFKQERDVIIFFM